MTDNSSEIALQVVNWLKSELSKSPLSDSLTEDSELIQSEIFDSMLILRCVSWLESQYDVNIGVELMTPDFFSSPKVIANNIVRLNKNS